MKRQEINKELKNMTFDALVAQLRAERDNLQKLNFAHAITPLKNPMRIRATRRYIAQISTEIKVRVKLRQAQQKQDKTQ
jgi:large subunit ribosomal protein L29